MRKRREFVARPRPWVVLSSLGRRVQSAQLAIERLERTGGSKRAIERWRRQIERARAMRAHIIERDWEALI